MVGQRTGRARPRASRWLDGLGVRPGATVPALVATNPHSVALVLAGAATGRPIAPLGVRLTEHELSQTLQRIASDVVVAATEFAEIGARIAERAGKRLEVFDAFAADPDRIAQRTHPDSIAALVHTSGTTGLPKPVPYRNKPLLRRVAVNSTLMGLGPGCAYATASPFHHIAGLGNVFVAMGSGATLVSMPKFSAGEWQHLDDLGVTHAFVAATMIGMLMSEDKLRLKNLRLLQYGASTIRPETLRAAMEQLPGVDFINFFGQTEGSPITVLTPDDHRRAVQDRPDLLESVGRPPEGVEITIHDPDHHGVGEVWARAEHMFRTEDDGWLHTGDMGRLDDEGYLFLTGRKGDLIIRGGENVYPIEVEGVLIRHPAVREVAVVGRPDERVGETVKAYIVPLDPASPPDPEELRRFTREQLAGFKVPTDWELTTALPRDTSGKLLRRRLV
ncbi:class I adenylate-forming enzyme family protein [Phytohabitans suffuscus]|uniref:class I adenylate-forming enzyme family protein n=1 Tax=Phytohabitans suffuscus TaxID=624315 RepID=UPI0022B299DD|nr:class I adenylate-forming enzyme family protein [Phytohabitans suffuscus]